jgi:hypothetical protein
MSSSEPITLLEAGITVEFMAKHLKIDAAPIQAAVAKEIEDLHAVAGLDITIAWLDPDDESTIAKFKDQIVNGPKEGTHYDGIGIGWGARSTPELTPIFEDLVNFCKDKSPKSKLLFNQSPNDLLEPVKRQFPEWAKAQLA